MKLRIIFLLLICIFVSCEEPKKDDDPIKIKNEAVFILNEGNMGYGNASIDLYDPATGEVDRKVFFKNNGRPLGDVLENFCVVDNEAYLVVNNSSKVEVVELPSFLSVGSIQNLPSPRMMLPIDDSKAYISDFKANEIHIIDLNSKSKIGGIYTGAWVEGMALSNGKVFACHPTEDEVLVVDTQNDSILLAIPTGIEPLSIVSDKNGDIWVLCTGGLEEDFPALLKIDPITETVVKTFSFTDIKSYPDNLQIDEKGEESYFLNDGLYKMGIDDNALPSAPFIDAEGRLLYGYGLDPYSGHIYLSDAIDYQQKGSVYLYDASGNQMDVFKAGIIPGAFGFWREE